MNGQRLCLADQIGVILGTQGFSRVGIARELIGRNLGKILGELAGTEDAFNINGVLGHAFGSVWAVERIVRFFGLCR